MLCLAKRFHGEYDRSSGNRILPRHQSRPPEGARHKVNRPRQVTVPPPAPVKRGRGLAGAALTGTTDVPSVAWAAHGPSMERARRPFSQLSLRAQALTGTAAILAAAKRIAGDSARRGRLDRHFAPLLPLRQNPLTLTTKSPDPHAEKVLPFRQKGTTFVPQRYYLSIKKVLPFQSKGTTFST